MAYAARFATVLLWVVSLLGGSVWAQEKAPPPAPSLSIPASAPSGIGGQKSLDGGGTVSLLGYVLTIVVLGAAGFTVLLRVGFFGASWGASKAVRKLHIEESRMVGNRQHLMVAEYEGRRVLLGVSPGRIDFLCGLESEPAGQGLGFSEALSDATAGAFSPPKSAAGEGGTKETQ